MYIKFELRNRSVRQIYYEKFNQAWLQTCNELYYSLKQPTFSNIFNQHKSLEDTKAQKLSLTNKFCNLPPKKREKKQIQYPCLEAQTRRPHALRGAIKNTLGASDFCSSVLYHGGRTKCETKTFLGKVSSWYARGVGYSQVLVFYWHWIAGKFWVSLWRGVKR